MIRLVLNKATRSLNETMRQHWASRKREANLWGAMLLGQIRQHLPAKATGKRRLTIERYGRRQIDEDNIVGGAKDLIDQIKKFGLLIDDSPEFMELVVTQPKLPKGATPHVVLLLEDL